MEAALARQTDYLDHAGAQVGWALNSCDVPHYKPICNRVEVVRTVDHLASAVKDLINSPV